MSGGRVHQLLHSDFEPLCCKVVGHDACPETLQERVFDFVQSMGVRDEGAMVLNNSEVIESSEENVAFFDGPSNCQTSKFNDCIPAFHISEEAGSSLHSLPL